MLRNERGSMTMESALIFPLVFMTVITVVLVSLWIYEQVVLYQRASVIAERMAFVWDNSHKDAVTGQFDVYNTSRSPGQGVRGDGLYWRLFDDQMLARLLPPDMIAPVTIVLGEQSSNSLPAHKMSRSSQFLLHDGVKGRLTYESSLTARNIIVELEKSVPAASMLEPIMGDRTVKVSARSTVTEPVEIIRTTDLIITYASRISQYGDILMQEAHGQLEPWN